MMAQRRQYVGILDQAKRRGRARSVLLQLLLGRVGGAPVGNGRDHDRCVGGQRVFDRRQHLARGLDIDAGDPGGRGQMHGPRH